MENAAAAFPGTKDSRLGECFCAAAVSVFCLCPLDLQWGAVAGILSGALAESGAEESVCS